MNEISIDQIQEIGQYWIVYLKESGATAHIQLSACANNFSIHRGGDADDGLKCVGLRYEKDGCDCYELFNVGHTLIKCPRKPGLGQSIKAMFKGKRAEDFQREKYEDFERQLNAFGWKTVQAYISPRSGGDEVPAKNDYAAFGGWNAEDGVPYERFHNEVTPYD